MLSTCRQFVHRLSCDRRGNVTMLFALMVVPLLLMSGIAVDLGRAERERDNAQAALDSAVLAGARAGTDYKVSVAEAVYASNVGNTYGAEVVPSFAEQEDGTFTGSATFSMNTLLGRIAHLNTFTMTVSATAAQGEGNEYCVLALGKHTTTALQANGAPKASLGCNVASNSAADCNGHNLGAPIGRAVGTNSGCGVSKESNKAALTDPYSSLASNIIANPCTTYSFIPAIKKAVALLPSNIWSGAKSLTGILSICGDLQLSANTTITAASGAVVIVWNGSLDLNGYTLKTAAGSGLTIILAGTSSSSYQHTITGSGTLDIAAPTSGTWKGVAIYQASNLTLNVDITYTGNSPTWNITGLVYLPNAAVTFKGAVNKSSNGYSCFVLVSESVLVSGTGSIFSGNTQCAQAGLTMPTDTDGEIRLTN